MPFLLVTFGVLIVIAAIRDTLGALATQVSTDLSAKNGGVSFAAWFAAIVLIGAIGYIPNLQTFSRALLFLVIIVIALKSGTGFFSQLSQQLQNVPASSPVAAAVPANFPAAIPVTVQQPATTSTAPSGTSSLPGAASGAAELLSLFGGL